MSLFLYTDGTTDGDLISVTLLPLIQLLLRTHTRTDLYPIIIQITGYYTIYNMIKIKWKSTRSTFFAAAD